MATYTATTGVDSFPGTSGADIFIVNAENVLNAGDAFNGAGGTDTLRLVGTASGGTYFDFHGVTLTSIEAVTFLPDSNVFGMFAVFTGSQFGAGIPSTLTLTGSNQSSDVFFVGEISGVFSAFNWSLVNWSNAGGDQIRLVGTTTNDTIYGGGDFDLLLGQADNDFLYGEAGNDALVGDIGNDLLDGGIGVDYLEGGAGDDTYYVDNFGDYPLEQSGQGYDIIYASTSYSITANVEEMILTGSALNGDGNNGANTIRGNALSNEIRGLGGDDFIIGGGGTDFLYGGTGADTFVYLAPSDSAPANLDAIMDFEIGVDKIDLSAVRTGGADTFTLIESGGSTFVHVDLGGNGSDDLLINVYQVTGLTAGDLVW